MSYEPDYYNCEHPDYFSDYKFEEFKEIQFEKLAKEFEVDLNDMSNFEKICLEEEFNKRFLDGDYYL